MKISRTFRCAGVKFLWNRADTRNLITYVHDASRRKKLASWIEHVVFFDHEVLWPSQTYSCPKFPRIRTLQLYGTSLCASRPSALVPFLSPTLRELSIWTQSEEADQPIRRQGDSVWVSRLRTSCAQLSVLNLEATLDITSSELASLFHSVTQVEKLRLSHELNPILDVDSISAIFALPNLKQFSMDCPLHEDLVQGLLSFKLSTTMLPKIKSLVLNFEINDSLAAAILLEQLESLEELVITFRPTAEGLIAALHPAFFTVISALPQLTSLTLWLPATIIIPCHGLAAVAAQEGMRHFTIPSTKDGFPESHGYIFLTGRDLLDIPMSHQFLEALDSISIASPIQATHDEVTAVTQTIMNVSPPHLRMFEFEVDESSSFGWPSAEDWEPYREESDRAGAKKEPKEMIWKASRKAFAPDHVEWSSRDLNIYTGKDGKVLSLDRVATKGDYNHIY